MYIHIYMYICIYVYTYTYILICIYVCVPIGCNSIYKQLTIPTYLSIYLYKYIYIRGPLVGHLGRAAAPTGRSEAAAPEKPRHRRPTYETQGVGERRSPSHIYIYIYIYISISIYIYIYLYIYIYIGESDCL